MSAFLAFVCLFCVRVALAGAAVVTEFALPDGVSSPQSMLVNASGHVWFAEKVGKSLTVFVPEEKHYKGYPLPESWGSMGPSRIALGVRGEIWFTVRRWAEAEVETNLLGQFIPGQDLFKQHALPKGVVPEDLLVDNHGVVWFTNPDENSIQRFDPRDLSLKGYVVPTPYAYPRGMAADKKGRIWFSEANVNRIGSFDSETETFQEFELPTPFANPGMVTVGWDGRIWFVEMTANQIGVFYPDLKRFDEIALPTQRATPNAIGTDDEGRVWFLEYRGNHVGLFHPLEATFREFVIPTYGSLPGGLVIDLKRKRLWFSETATEAKKLGMIDMTHLPARVLPQEAPSSDPRSEEFYVWLLSLLVAAALLVAVLVLRKRVFRR